MKYLKSLILPIILLASTVANAKAPFIDYQYTNNHYGYNCLNQAESSMIDSGFIITSSTGSMEIVGSKGNYKAVIACLTRYNVVIFTVAGSNYKNARWLAKKLKNNF
jgi:hypothetical protein